MNVRLRIVDPERDAKPIWDTYEYYIQNTVATYNEANKPIEVRAQEIEDLVKMYPFWVAEDENGAFLGFANAEPVRPQSGYRFAVELTIYLHPDAPKGAGIGKKLYEKLFDCLKAQGFHIAYAVIDSGNAHSIALHEHFGFTEAARFENCGFKHGRWLSSVWMQKVFLPFADAPSIIPFETYRQSL